jgi:hypothetical protein
MELLVIASSKAPSNAAALTLSPFAAKIDGNQTISLLILFAGVAEPRHFFTAMAPAPGKNISFGFFPLLGLNKFISI